MNQEKKQAVTPKIEGQLATKKNRMMSKSTFYLVEIVAVFIILGLLTGIYYLRNEKRENEQQIEALNFERQLLNDQVMQHDSIVDQWMLTLEEIESDLIRVQGKEQKLSLSEFDPEKTPDLRENILSEIQSVNTIMERNRSKIKSLQAQLKKSGFRIDALEEKLIALQSFVEQRDSTITILKNDLVTKDFQMAELNIVIDSLKQNVNKVEEKVTLKEAELNKAFIAQGNYKDLKAKGIIDKEGGIFGLGKNKTINDNAVDSYFNEVGIKETTQIAVNAKKAKLITEHPTDSYQLIENDSLVAYIDIIQPDEFWRLSRYAVIETK